MALRRLAHSPHPVPRPWATSVPGTRTRGWDPLHPVLCCLALVGGWSSGHCDFWGRARPPAVLSPCVLLFVHCGNQRRLPAGSRPGGQLCRGAVEAPEPQRSFPGWPGGATAPAAGHCQDFPGRLSQQPGPGGLGGGEMAFVIIPGLAGAAGQPVTRALSLGHPSPAHFAERPGPRPQQQPGGPGRHIAVLTASGQLQPSETGGSSPGRGACLCSKRPVLERSPDELPPAVGSQLCCLRVGRQ